MKSSFLIEYPDLLCRAIIGFLLALSPLFLAAGQDLRINDEVFNVAPQAAVRSTADWFPDGHPNNNLQYLVGNGRNGTIIGIDENYPGNDGFDWYLVDWGEFNGMQIIGWTADHGADGDRLYKRLPNLTYDAGSGETSDDPVVVGDQFRLRYTIKNTSAGYGHATEARIQLRDEAGNLVAVEEVEDDEVEPNDDDRQSHRFTLPANAPRGRYTALVELDHDNTLDEIHEDDNSFSFEFDVIRLPPIPSVINASQAEGSPNVTIAWLHDDSDDTSGYSLERRINGAGDFVTIANLDSPTFIYSDEGAANGNSYEYRVKGIGPDGESDFSPIASIDTVAPVVSPSITNLSRNFLPLSTRRQGLDINGANFDDDAEVWVHYPSDDPGDFSKLSSYRVDVESDMLIEISLPQLRVVGQLQLYVKNPNGLQSETYSVDVGGLITPQLISPANGATGLNPSLVTVQWENNNSSPQPTEVRVSLDEVSGYGVVPNTPPGSTPVPISAESLTFTGLAPNQWYVWKVRFTFSGGEERFKVCWFYTGQAQNPGGDTTFSWRDGSSLTKKEGASLTLELRRSGVLSAEQVVSIRAGHTGETNDSDFTLLTPKVTFPENEPKGYVLINLEEDNENEGTEGFEIEAHEVDGVSFSSPIVLQISISDDPLAPTTGSVSGSIANLTGVPAPVMQLNVSDRSAPVAVNANGSFTIPNVVVGQSITVIPQANVSGVSYTFDPPKLDGIQVGESISFDLVSISYDTNPNRDDNSTPTNIADPIDAATGAQVLTLPLLNLHGLRPLSMGLGYNSLERTNAGTCGHGWFHSFERSIQENADGTITYHKTPNLSYSFFAPEFGSGTYLSTNPDLRYHTLAENDNGQFELLSPDQSKLIFNETGQLAAQITPQGQALLFSYQDSLLHRVTEPVTGVYFEFSYTRGLVSEIEDGFGRAFTITHDGSFLERITYPITSISRLYEYTPEGLLDTGRIFDVDDPEITDIAIEGYPGGRLLFDNMHDAQGRVEFQEDGRPGNHGAFGYSTLASGNLQTVYTDREGETYTYEFSPQLNMIRLTRPDTKVVEQSFYSNGDLKTLTLPGRAPIQYDYAPTGGVSRIVDPTGNETSLTLDGKNNPLSIIDALDKETVIAFNDLNLPTEISDELDQISQVRYNDSGQALQEENADGDCTDMIYASGRLRYVDSPDDRRITIGRDAYGRPNSWTNAENETISVIYDDLDRVTTYTDEEDYQYHIAYDGQNNVLKITTPLPDADNPGEFHAYDFEYDGNRNLVKIINPRVDGVRSFSQRGYDLEDRLIWIEDEEGRRTTILRDSLGRVEGYRDATNKGTDMTLDDYGNTLDVTDALGNLLSSSTYNDLNRLETWTSDEGRDLTLEYDDSIRLKWIQRVDGKKRLFFYDSLDRLDYEETPLGRKTKYGYDPLSAVEKIFQQTTNLTAETLFTQYIRNGNREIEEVVTPMGKRTRYDRDDIGRLETITREDDSLREFTYDDRGLLETDTIGASIRSRTYDELGRKRTCVEGAKSQEWEYDPIGRVAVYTDHHGDDIEYDYYPNHLLKRITYEPGIYVDYFYDSRNLLTTVRDWANREIVYTYYDNHLLHTATYPNGLVETRTYNKVQELKAIVVAKPDGTIVWDYEVGRNNLGLIEMEARDPRNTPNASLTSFSPETPDPVYNEDNMVISIDEVATTHDGRRNLTNVTINGNPDQFAYTPRDELENFDGVWYIYNSDGDKVSQVDGGVSTDYTLDGAHPYRRVLQEKRSDRSQPKYFVYGLGLCYSVTGGDFECYTFDIRGSTCLLTNTAGERTNVFDYSPYGTLIRQLAPPETQFLYNGKYGVRTEREGLLYMRARHYSPKLRRFLAPDPIGQSGGLNTYAYANSDPIGYVDPFGLAPSSSNSDSIMPFELDDDSLGSICGSQYSKFNFSQLQLVTSYADTGDVLCHFSSSYLDMRKANTIGADKYFHCLANCRASSESYLGEVQARVISDTREYYDYLVKGDSAEAIIADQNANDFGRFSGELYRENNYQISNKDYCRLTCGNLRPEALGEEY